RFEGISVAEPSEGGCLTGDGGGTSDRQHPAFGDRAGVDAHYHVGIEDGEQRVIVAAPCGGQERVDDLSHAVRVRVGWRDLSPYALTRTAGQFLGCPRGAVHDRGDLFEGDREHVVQDERQPFGGAQGLQYHQQRETDGVGDQRLLFGVA